VKIILHIEDGIVQRALTVPDGSPEPSLFTCDRDVLENGDPLRLFPVESEPLDPDEDPEIAALVRRAGKKRLTSLTKLANWCP
jgi:hypothetical protein